MTEVHKDKKLEISDPEKLEPKFANTFKIGFSEGSFEIHFGYATNVDEEKIKIKIISKIVLADEKMPFLILALFKAGKDYENKFGKKIFPEQKKNEE